VQVGLRWGDGPARPSARTARRWPDPWASPARRVSPGSISDGVERLMTGRRVALGFGVGEMLSSCAAPPMARSSAISCGSWRPDRLPALGRAALHPLQDQRPAKLRPCFLLGQFARRARTRRLHPQRRSALGTDRERGSGGGPAAPGQGLFRSAAGARPDRCCDRRRCRYRNARSRPMLERRRAAGAGQGRALRRRPPGRPPQPNPQPTTSPIRAIPIRPMA
jgi:hypothetical protein